MASKVKWERGAWWVFTHYDGKRKKKRIGTTKAKKREAEQIAKTINAALALGAFEPESHSKKSLPCDAQLRSWHETYSPTMKLFRIALNSDVHPISLPHLPESVLEG